MTALTEDASVASRADALPLERSLTLRDLVLFHVVAVLGLRWVATAAKTGPSAVTLWLLAALFFFIPQGLAVVAMSSRLPEEGGVYAWTRRTLGEGHGFLCGWCYWINNVLYYPNLLISTAVIGTFAIGRGDSGLESNWLYVLGVALSALWLAVALNIVGLGTGKWLQNLGAIGSYVPGVLLILLGLYAVATRGPANPVSAPAMVPHVNDLSSLNLWASIAFAFTGLELAAAMGGEIKEPRRNLPRSIYIAAPLVAAAYVLGTGAIVWLMPVGDINIVSGFLQAIAAGAQNVSPALWWLPVGAAAMYALGNVGGVGAWLAGPARVAFVIGLDRFFPPAFGKVHPRWRTPYVAILVQAGLGTVFLLLSVLGKGSTVEHAYLILLDTQLLIYFIPYIYLFVCVLVVGRRDVATRAGGGETGHPAARAGTPLFAASGLIVTVLAMIVAMIPPADGTNALLFEAKVVGGAAMFVAIGGIIYRRGQRRAATG